MSIPARLSRAIVDRLGEAVGGELVQLLNEVDAGWKAERRDLDEFGFARLDATLERRLIELRTQLRTDIARLGTERHSAQIAMWPWVFGALLLVLAVGLMTLVAVLRGS